MDWLKEINAAVTICDKLGIIVYMNEKSEEVFKDDGGKNLIGSNLFGCHPEPALTKLKEMIEDGSTNVYTIEKKGVKKIIYQTPWFNENTFGGLIEISFNIPDEMPHFLRKP